MEQICLTKYARGGGGGCKLDPSALQEILAHVPHFGEHANLLVGIASDDDAAVYRINDQQAIVITNDFFTPIVDDPYAFGRIAAANSISDVYAMGGTPLLAVSIVGFPVNKLPLYVMQDILRGGVDTCLDAGIPLAGGHSIDSEEAIFGLCVMGLVHPERIKFKAGARVGDVLIMTKPLGIGILSTAMKVGAITPTGYEKVVGAMSSLNKAGAWLGGKPGVHALTDVTGLGLAGHALEMARGAGVSMTIDVGKVPVMEEAWELAREGIVPGGAHRNLASCGSAIEFNGDLHPDHQLIFTDPQTSGGLLMAVAPDAVDEVVTYLKRSGCLAAEVIGRVVPANGSSNVRFEGSR